MAEAAFFFCAYEFAIMSVNSPWCQALDENDAKVGAIIGQRRFNHDNTADIFQRCETENKNQGWRHSQCAVCPFDAAIQIEYYLKRKATQTITKKIFME